MHLTIRTRSHVHNIRPGDLIDGGDAGTIEVDEVRLGRPAGTTPPVTVFGRRPGASNGRRQALKFHVGDLVDVLPAEPIAVGVWGLVVDALAQAYDDPRGSDPVVPGIPSGFDAQWGVEDGVIWAKYGNTRYDIIVEPDPASDPDPDFDGDGPD